MVIVTLTFEILFLVCSLFKSSARIVRRSHAALDGALSPVYLTLIPRGNGQYTSYAITYMTVLLSRGGRYTPYIHTMAHLLIMVNMSAKFDEDVQIIIWTIVNKHYMPTSGQSASVPLCFACNTACICTTFRQLCTPNEHSFQYSPDWSDLSLCRPQRIGIQSRKIHRVFYTLIPWSPHLSSSCPLAHKAPFLGFRNQ